MFANLSTKNIFSVFQTSSPDTIEVGAYQLNSQAASDDTQVNWMYAIIGSSVFTTFAAYCCLSRKLQQYKRANNNKVSENSPVEIVVETPPTVIMHKQQIFHHTKLTNEARWELIKNAYERAGKITPEVEPCFLHPLTGEISNSLVKLSDGKTYDRGFINDLLLHKHESNKAYVYY